VSRVIDSFEGKAEPREIGKPEAFRKGSGRAEALVTQVRPQLPSGWGCPLNYRRLTVATWFVVIWWVVILSLGRLAFVDLVIIQTVDRFELLK
jgi:hypothetical protein